MKKLSSCACLALIVIVVFPGMSSAWYDETHLAVAKGAGYHKWYNAVGADIAEIKAGKIESHNHHSKNPPGIAIIPEMVISQADKYNQIEPAGHLYGAIIQSVRDYIRVNAAGEYAEYHLAYCAHYVGDLSQPLHSTPRNAFNRKVHKTIDGMIDAEDLDNIDRIKTYPISIKSEADLAKEIARTANAAMKLGYKIESEDRVLTEQEAYQQISHGASLFKAILSYVKKP